MYIKIFLGLIVLAAIGYTITTIRTARARRTYLRGLGRDYDRRIGGGK